MAHEGEITPPYLPLWWRKQSDKVFYGYLTEDIYFEAAKRGKYIYISFPYRVKEPITSKDWDQVEVIASKLAIEQYHAILRAHFEFRDNLAKTDLFAEDQFVHSREQYREWYEIPTKDLEDKFLSAGQPPEEG